ncbi:MAG: hypothetical protein IJC49_02070 [Clostridia bacterium]|nr:hypothetical protein [Clostridia bacterium]
MKRLLCIQTPYLLQFAVTQGGTYTVVVTRMDSGASITHDVAISWY